MAATKKAKKSADKKSSSGKKVIWEKENPKPSSKGLTKAEKQEAKQAAKADGRAKPSLVDNINAKKKKGKKTKTGKASKKN